MLLSAACTELEGPGDEGWTELGGDRPVLFNSSLAAPVTKSSTLPDNTTFGVFAFYQPGTSGNPGTWSNSRTPDFMFNQPVLFRLADSPTSSNTYTYSPTRYWPSNDYNTLTFWAYYPYTATPDFLVANSTDPYTNTSAGIPDIRFNTDSIMKILTKKRIS